MDRLGFDLPNHCSTRIKRLSANFGCCPCRRLPFGWLCIRDPSPDSGGHNVRSDVRPAPKKSIDIDTQLSDRTVATSEGDRNRITLYILGHSSHKKMGTTSAVIDGTPKYCKFNTWCTSCQKGKMHVKSHAQNLWQVPAEHKNDVWHIDLIGKFRSWC